MQDHLRVLRTRAWVGRTLLALFVIAACFALSYWQYVRTQDQLAVARAAVSQPTSYAEAMPSDAEDVPVAALGRQVVVTGEVLPGARSFVRSRQSSDGRTGVLVVDGVRIDDGRVVAVAQGWVPEPAAAADLAGRRVEITGRLQPDENFYATAPVSQAEPLLTVTAKGLGTQWADAAGAPVPAPGYVVAATPAAPGFEPARPVIGADPDVPFPWQNAFYTLQWLIFAGIVVVIWWRWLHDDVLEERAHAETVPEADRGSLEDHELGSRDGASR